MPRVALALVYHGAREMVLVNQRPRLILIRGGLACGDADMGFSPISCAAMTDTMYTVFGTAASRFATIFTA